VLELEDLEDRAFNLDVVSVFELVGADQGESVLLEPNIDVVAAAQLHTATDHDSARRVLSEAVCPAIVQGNDDG